MSSTQFELRAISEYRNNQATLLIRGLKPFQISEAQRIMKILADKYLYVLKMMILQHSKAGLNWPPHSATTNKLWGAHHLLRMTGAYYAAMKIRKKQQGDNVTYTVGAFPEDLHVVEDPWTHRNNIINMKELAEILENGNPNNRVFGRGVGPIPPRPHHGPAQWYFIRMVAGKTVTEESLKGIQLYWKN